jgi:hypothetical protein
MYAFIFSLRAACPIHLIIRDFMDVAVIKEECRLWVQKSRSRLKTLDARRVTWSKLESKKKVFFCPRHEGIQGGEEV